MSKSVSSNLDQRYILDQTGIRMVIRQRHFRNAPHRGKAGIRTFIDINWYGHRNGCVFVLIAAKWVLLRWAKVFGHAIHSTVKIHGSMVQKLLHSINRYLSKEFSFSNTLHDFVWISIDFHFEKIVMPIFSTHPNHFYFSITVSHSHQFGCWRNKWLFPRLRKKTMDKSPIPSTHGILEGPKPMVEHMALAKHKLNWFVVSRWSRESLGDLKGNNWTWFCSLIDDCSPIRFYVSIELA